MEIVVEDMELEDTLKEAATPAHEIPEGIIDEALELYYIDYKRTEGRRVRRLQLPFLQGKGNKSLKILTGVRYRSSVRPENGMRASRRAQDGRIANFSIINFVSTT